MSSKASYSRGLFKPSVSAALIGENLRRFWTIPAFSFLAYLVFCVAPMFVARNGMRDHNLESLLDSQHPVIALYGCLFPAITAVVLFRYLHSTASVSAMHSMPFTRMRLFFSNAASGLIMLWAPTLLAGLLILAFKPDYANLDWSSYNFGSEYDVMEYTAELLAHPGGWQIMSETHVLAWMGGSLLISLFVFALCVLAGTVTGNVPLHLLICAFLNIVAVAGAGLGIVYMDKFLFGFDSSAPNHALLYLSPVTAFAGEQGAPGAVPAAVYLLAALAVLVFAALLYSRRALEKAGDSFVFGFMEVFACYFAAYAGMTGMGFYFMSLFSEEMFPVGLAVGAALAFLVSCMIARKSPRIWNRRTFAFLGVYALAAAVFLAGLQWDVAGYENRLPEAGAVETAQLSGNYNFIRERRIQYIGPGLVTSLGIPQSYGVLEFKEPANVAAVRALHQMVLSEKGSLERRTAGLVPMGTGAWDARYAARYMEFPYFSIRGALFFEYGGTGLGSFRRRYYDIPKGLVVEDDNYRKLLGSEEYRRIFDLKNPVLGVPVRATVYRSYFAELGYENGLSDFTKEQVSSLLDAVQKDLDEEPYEQITGAAKPLYLISFEFERAADRAVGWEPQATATIGGGRTADVAVSSLRGTEIVNVELNVPSHFAHTEAWLKANGLYEELNGWMDEVGEVTLTRWVRKDFTETGSEAISSRMLITSADGPRMVAGTAQQVQIETHTAAETLRVTDPGKIRELIMAAETQTKNYDEYWECSFTLGDDGRAGEDEEVMRMKDRRAGLSSSVFPEPYRDYAWSASFVLDLGSPALEGL